MSNPLPKFRQSLRATVFVVVLTWILVVPVLRQGIGLNRWWTHDWGMFAGAGRSLIDARFFDAKSGAFQRIDRRAVIQPAEYRNGLYSDTQVLKFARLLCRTRGPGSDIRVITREMGRKGWERVHDGSVNLCVTANAE